MGRRVLAIDLDPQGGLSCALAASELVPPCGSAVTAADLLGDDAVERAPELPCNGLIPAGRRSRLLAVEHELTVTFAAHRRLSNTLAAIRESRPPDVVVIDTPPSAGALTYTACVAADGILGAAEPSALNYATIADLQRLISSVAQLHSDNKKPNFLGLMLSKVHRNRKITDSFRRWAEEDAVPVLPFAVPALQIVADAAVSGRPVVEIAPDNPASLVYHDCAKALFSGTSDATPLRSAPGDSGATSVPSKALLSTTVQRAVSIDSMAHVVTVTKPS